MKKYRRTYTIFLASLVLMAGCEDFLEIKPQGELTQEAFPTTAADAQLAVNACYTVFRQWHYHSGGYPILDIMSDDSHKGSTSNDQLSTIGPYDEFQHTVTQDGLDRWWSTLYQGIKRANVVIEKVPDIDMDEDLKNEFVAEAKFVRGILYFDLVRAWGGVPLVTSTTPPLQLEKTTKNAIYDQVEQDFLDAIEALPLRSELSSDELGRATRGAAQAFLAKVYLFQADFVNAELYALEVINSKEYDLETDFASANSETGEHGVESIFEIGAMTVEGGENAGNQYANTQGVRGTPNRGWGFNRPSIDLRDSFDPDDPRMDATIIFLGEVLDGVEIRGDGTTPDEVLDDDNNVIEIECYNQKVWTPGQNTVTQWGHNRRLMRYADVLLMAAEALNENEDPDQALGYLNQVRERARGGKDAILPDVTETGKDALRDLIILERRYELALEGHRFWDLVRTGKAPEILGPLGFVEGKHELLPIPQTEIDISQGTLEQNPNWQ